MVANDGTDWQPRPSYCVLVHADGGSPSACAGDGNYNDNHVIPGATYTKANLNSSGGCVAGGSGVPCCIISSSGGTPFNSIGVYDDDWMDLEIGQPDPCFRQTGGQG